MSTEQYNDLQTQEAQAWADHETFRVALDRTVDIARENYNQACNHRYGSPELKRLGAVWQEHYARLRQAEAVVIGENEMARL
jgi:hypothetical protein